MKQSFKIISKILTFILVLVVLDQIIGYFLERYYFLQKSGPNHSLTYSLGECTSDILIFGASAAQHHYDTRIIEDSLKMSCYNAGQDGGHSVLLQYAQIKVITGRYKPRMIILEFNPYHMGYYAGDYDNLQILLPYQRKYPQVKEIVELRGEFEKVKLVSAMYPFNSLVINIIRFNSSRFSFRKIDYNGYVPIKGIMPSEIMKKKEEIDKRTEPDANKVEALKNIISICKSNHIPLFIFSSPIYHGDNDSKKQPTHAAEMALDIIKNENIPFFDFSFEPLFNEHPEWFKDKSHLNEKGATEYTLMVIDALRRDKPVLKMI